MNGCRSGAWCGHQHLGVEVFRLDEGVGATGLRLPPQEADDTADNFCTGGGCARRYSLVSCLGVQACAKEAGLVLAELNAASFGTAENCSFGVHSF